MECRQKVFTFQTTSIKETLMYPNIDFHKEVFIYIISGLSNTKV